MQWDGTEAQIAQNQRHTHGAVTRGGEDDGGIACKLVEHIDQVAVFVFGRNEQVVLCQRLNCGIPTTVIAYMQQLNRDAQRTHTLSVSVKRLILGINLNLDRVFQ
jgi:hypothetical protein